MLISVPVGFDGEPSSRPLVRGPYAARTAASVGWKSVAPDTGTGAGGARAALHGDEAAPSAPEERQEAEATDPAMAIDWLLNQSRTRGR